MNLSLLYRDSPADFVSVFTEAEDFGDLQEHAEDHPAGSRRGGQKVLERLGQRGVQEEQERHKPGKHRAVHAPHTCYLTLHLSVLLCLSPPGSISDLIDMIYRREQRAADHCNNAAW